MNRTGKPALTAILAFLAGVAVLWVLKPSRSTKQSDPVESPGSMRTADWAPSVDAESPFRTSAASSDPRRRDPNLLPTEKAARVARIKRDYDEIRVLALANFSVLTERSPAGLNDFLKQLAFVESQRRSDLAAVLTPQEIEDFEYRETPAGQVVHELLSDTTATEEQRRAVFRLQQAFDDQYALTFDSAPTVTLERERARCDLQEKIRAVLGDTLFAAWLRGEGAEFGHFSHFATQHNLPPSAAVELWRARGDFTVRRLAITAETGGAIDRSRAAYADAARQTQARLLAILGPGALQAAGPEVLGWLPR